MSDATALRALGWRQGSILPAALTEKLRQEGALRSDVDLQEALIVVSHDCDLLNPSLEKEPFVEVLRASPRENDDGTLRHGKNPRRLVIDVNMGRKLKVFETSVHDRVLLDRRVLLDHRPDASRTIVRETVSLIARWIVKRYYRAAFPDAFNERLRPAHRRFQNILSKGGSKISGIYLKLDEEELAPGQIYNVFAVATLPVEHYQHASTRGAAQECFDALAAAMNDCEGVAVEDHHLVSEPDFSLDELKRLKRWDWDDLSIREYPAGEMTSPE